jgi:hypothetical protein
VIAVEEVAMLLEDGLVRVFSAPVAACGALWGFNGRCEIGAALACVGEGGVLWVGEGSALGCYGYCGDGVGDVRGAVCEFRHGCGILESRNVV